MTKLLSNSVVNDSVDRATFEELLRREGPLGHRQAAGDVRRGRRPGHRPGPRRRLRHGRTRPVPRRPGPPSHRHRLRRGGDPAGPGQGGRAGPGGGVPRQGRTDARGLGRAVRQRDRLRPVPLSSPTTTGGATSGGWRVLEPGGRLFLMCFSDEEPGTEGPRRVSRQELYDAFADGWEVESVEPVRYRGEPGVHRGQVLGRRTEGMVRGRPSERVSRVTAPGWEIQSP